MTEPIENPPLYIGVLKGRDDVTLVIHPGTEQELRIYLSPTVALSVATELAAYGQKQLDRQLATVARHAHNTREAQRPRKLDS